MKAKQCHLSMNMKKKRDEVTIYKNQMMNMKRKGDEVTNTKGNLD